MQQKHQLKWLKQLKSKNNIHNPNDPIKTPIKFNHARIIHLSWSFVMFRNVSFCGNQTIFFIFLAVYEIKIILLILRTFSMHLFLFWMCFLYMEQQILHRPTLQPWKFNCLNNKWLKIKFHWVFTAASLSIACWEKNDWLCEIGTPFKPPRMPQNIMNDSSINIMGEVTAL